jgi:hypothetical protein
MPLGTDQAGAINKLNNVIRLRSRNENNYRRQNKSIVRNNTTESLKENDEI